MTPETREEVARCFRELSSLFSGDAAPDPGPPGSRSSSSPSPAGPLSPPFSGEPEVVLPWSAVEAVLGLGGRQLSGRGKANLRALRPDIERVADETGLPPALLAGLAFVESEGDPTALGDELPSGDRAVGLLQVIPRNLRRFGVPEERWTDPLVNLRAGARVLLEEPMPFGQVEPGETLASFGGFDAADPTDYIRDVQTLALRAARELGYSLLPRPPYRVPDL